MCVGKWLVQDLKVNDAVGTGAQFPRPPAQSALRWGLGERALPQKHPTEWTTSVTPIAITQIVEVSREGDLVIENRVKGNSFPMLPSITLLPVLQDQVQVKLPLLKAPETNCVASFNKHWQIPGLGLGPEDTKTARLPALPGPAVSSHAYPVLLQHKGYWV